MSRSSFKFYILFFDWPAEYLDVEIVNFQRSVYEKLMAVLPGELLLEEFLRPMGISRYRLAKEIGVPAQRIGDIVAGKRTISADTDLRLCRFFGLSNGYWLRAQAAFDTEIAERTIGPPLTYIRPWSAESKPLN
jgi:antitoxin HigA-1